MFSLHLVPPNSELVKPDLILTGQKEKTMSNHNHKKHPTISAQPDLFDTSLAEGTFDISLGFRQTLSRAIHNCGKDRFHVAAEVARLTSSNFSKDMLDKYTSSAPEYGIRAEVLTALCHVIGSMEPFRYLLEPLDADVLNPEDKDLVRLARLTEQRLTIDNEINQLRSKRGLK